MKVIAKANGGQASALNAAFRAHRGQIICLLDADDMFEPGKLQRLADYYRDQPEVGLVVHSMVLLDREMRRSDTIPFLARFEQGWIGDKLIRRGGRWRFMPSSALSFREELGSFCFPIPEERFRKNAESFIFTFLPLFTAVGSIADALSCYRMHDSNMSGEFLFNVKTLRYWESCIKTPNEVVNERLAAMGYTQRLDLNRNLDYAMNHFKLLMLEDQSLRLRLQCFEKLFSLLVRDDLIGFWGKSAVLLTHTASLFLHPAGRQWLFDRMISPSPAKRLLRRFRQSPQKAVGSTTAAAREEL